MRTIKFLAVALTVGGLAGCVSTKSFDVYARTDADTPKIIAVDGKRDPWVFEIEKRLKERGFQINRLVTQNVAIEEVTDRRTEAYNEASARFVLNIDGYAPNTSMTRCFGGGFNFKYINVELIDLVNNQTVMYYSNSGYSEDCPPMSGTIFGDIADGVSAVWRE